jgi:hypothetical protein
MADDATTEDSSPVDAVSGPDTPEYTFEGYEVEFSDLVVLTPVAPETADKRRPTS